METNKNNGGPAFPQHPDMLQNHPGTGMTLRDYFAAAVSASDLVAVRVREDREALAGRPQPADYPNGLDSIRFNIEVEAALRMMHADAMLAAREAA